jgi:hypothetical protein
MTIEQLLREAVSSCASTMRALSPYTATTYDASIHLNPSIFPEMIHTYTYKNPLKRSI